MASDLQHNHAGQVVQVTQFYYFFTGNCLFAVRDLSRLALLVNFSTFFVYRR